MSYPHDAMAQAAYNYLTEVRHAENGFRIHVCDYAGMQKVQQEIYTGSHFGQLIGCLDTANYSPAAADVVVNFLTACMAMHTISLAN